MPFKIAVALSEEVTLKKTHDNIIVIS